MKITCTDGTVFSTKTIQMDQNICGYVMKDDVIVHQFFLSKYAHQPVTRVRRLVYDTVCTIAESRAANYQFTL